MPFQLWFQYNSEKKQDYQQYNKPLVSFLEQILPLLIPKIRNKIEFKVVDNSKPSDVKRAQQHGVTSLPMLITAGNKITGISKIQDYMKTLLKSSDAAKKQGSGIVSNRVEDDINEPTVLTEEDEEIRNMWQEEIVENSDEDENDDEDMNERKERASAIMAQRKKLGEQRMGTGRRAGGNNGRKGAKSRPTKNRPASRTSRTTPKGNREEEESGMDAPAEQETQERSSRRTRKKARDNVNTVELTVGLDGNAEQRQDDGLMARFWENNESTQY